MSEQIAKDYTNGTLSGWLETRQPGIAKEQFDLLNQAGAFKPMKIVGATREKRKKNMLYWYTRKVLGHDTKNYAQLIGDCISFGCKNVHEYDTCSQILAKALAIHGDDKSGVNVSVATGAFKFRQLFPPFFYGTGRNYIGHNQIDGDGSLGSWMCEAAKKYGGVFADEPGVPAYSAEVATNFGDSDSTDDLDKWRDYASHYTIKTTAKINSWDELTDALDNNYGVTTASNVGYDMLPSNDGFHHQTANWGHQLSIIGYDEEYKNGDEHYGIILNSWSDVHGHLKDFTTGEDLPLGVLRVRRKDIEKHIAAGETYAYSSFNAFPEQKLDKVLFLLS